MSTNQVQKGEVIEVTAPYALTGNDGCLVGAGLFGVAVTDAAIATQVSLCVTGVFDLAKQAALAINAGDFIYWDDAARECDTTNTNLLVGVAIAAAAGADTTVRVRLYGAGHP